MWEKALLTEALEAKLVQELEAAVSASRDAASYATDEESRATSKWDTQGLEASYLAAGQAQQARELDATRQRLRSAAAELAAPKSYGALGALITCKIGIRGGVAELYWLVPEGAGGHELQIEGSAITCLNAQSPLGRALLGKGEGDSFSLPNGIPGTIIAIR